MPIIKEHGQEEAVEVMPKYYRSRKGRILKATPMLFRNKAKLELQSLSEAEAKAFDEKNEIESTTEVKSAKAEAAEIIKAAQEEVKTKSAQVEAKAKQAADKAIADAKAEAAKIIAEAKATATKAK